MMHTRSARTMSPLPRAACLILVVFYVFLAGNARGAYDFVVAQDGSGNFTTVQAAILAVPDYNAARTTIFIKAGTYKEKLTVPRSKRRLTLLGENRDTTILTYDDHATVSADESVSGTAQTPSIYIYPRDFAARNLTFSNTAGDAGPAIALAVQGARARFRNCAILGYQDTLYTTSIKVYFKRCYIAGATDFIFGNSTAVFQGCTIDCVDSGFITAACTAETQSYGYVFMHCKITGSAPAGSVFLGRPWTAYARVVFADCDMDDIIEPTGWDDWGDASNQATAYYAEYNSTGAGADPADRVDWSHQLTADEFADYTVDHIFGLLTVPVGTKELTVAAPWYNDY